MHEYIILNNWSPVFLGPSSDTENEITTQKPQKEIKISTDYKKSVVKWCQVH